MIHFLKILLFILFFHGFVFFGQSQTFDNIQYFSSDHIINPANAGNHIYQWRLYNHYYLNKTIASNGYQSFYLAGDYNISRFPNKFSLGMYFKHENISSNPLNVDHLFITGSYHFRFQETALSIGIQPGIVISQLDQNKLTFPDQYDRETGGYYPGAPSQEVFWIEPQKIAALNAGATYRFPWHGNYYEAGIAYLFLNTANESFYQSTLLKQLNITLKTEFIFNQLTLQPFAWINASELFYKITLGAFANYNVSQLIEPLSGIIAGAKISFSTNKYPNNASIMLGLQWKRVMATINYKYPFRFNNNLVHEFNTFELALVFNGFNANLTKFVLPCEFF